MKVITSRERDLGGFSVHRILPHAALPMVGPFIFFDHIGPADFQPGSGIDVRPHPHVNLATVTYLFEGAIHHRDSLGSDQLIEPGAVNWMVAGHGIVHSERTPPEKRQSGGKLSGIQCWLALPNKDEEIAPNFTHYPSMALPIFEIGRVKLKLLLGTAFDFSSPVTAYSDLVYLEAKMPAGTTFTLPPDRRELAVYVVAGEIMIGSQSIMPFSLMKIDSENNTIMQAKIDTHIMLLGGEYIGKRFIYWNFVASSPQKIEQAKKDWAKGPGETSSRFPKILDDSSDFIPLPDELKPPGTIM